MEVPLSEIYRESPSTEAEMTFPPGAVRAGSSRRSEVTPQEEKSETVGWLA